MMDALERAQIRFAPRRLGHVNLWVSDLERAVSFYESICGLELVRRERDLLIAFHSNGNTHHDIGIIEVSKGRDRYGRDGMLQIPKTRGLAPGLNHFGWEMDTEKDLVEAYQRAQAGGDCVERTVDHLISHSVYVNDPDGNGHEFYADEMHDWRTIYNLDQEDEVTGEWDPLATAPKTVPFYNTDPEIRRVDRAPVHPSRLTGVRLGTRRLEPMLHFFTNVAGLTPRPMANDSDQIRLAGTMGRIDLTLVPVAAGEAQGLQAFRLHLNEDVDMAAVAAALRAKGIDASLRPPEVPGEFEELAIRDPDGFVIEFHRSAF